MTVTKNVIWGTYWSLCGACIYSAYALVLVAFRGSASFDANGTTLMAVIASYVLAALCVGVVLGLLRPIVRTVPGSVLVGLVCAAAALTCIRITMDGIHRWSMEELTDIGLLSVVFGSVGALAVRYHSRKLGLWRKEPP